MGQTRSFDDLRDTSALAPIAIVTPSCIATKVGSGISSPRRPEPLPFATSLWPPHLATTYSHATLREKVVSPVGELEYCRFAFDRVDKSLCDKPIENSPFVRLQIDVGSMQ